MAKQQDNLVYLNFLTGRNSMLGPNNSIAITSDLEVGGNLSVLGTMTYLDSEILTSDSYVFMNSDYTGSNNQNGGLIINSKIDNVVRGTLKSAVASTSTITITGNTSFNAGDILAVVGSTDKNNDGVYEVSSSSNPDSFTTAMVVKSVVTSGYEEMLKVSVVDEGEVTACVVGRCSISALRSDISSGYFEYGFGSNTGSINFYSVGASSPSLQVAYDNGSTVNMTASDGSLTVAPASGETVGFNITGNASSEVKTQNANTLTVATDSGALNLQSSTGNIITKTANTADIKLLTGSTEGSTDVFGRLLLDGNLVTLRANGTNGTLGLTSDSTLSLTSDTGAVVVNSSAGNMFLTSTNGDMAISAVGATSDVTISAGDEFTLNAGVTSSAGSIALGTTGGNIGLTTNTSGNITLDSVGTASITAGSGSASLTATDGPLTIMAKGNVNQGTLDISADNALTCSSDNTMSFHSTANAQTILISSVGPASTRAHAGSSSIVKVDADTLDLDAGAFTMTSALSGASNTIESTGSVSTLSLSATSDLSLTSSGGGVAGTGETVTLKGTASSGANLLKVQDNNSSDVLVVSNTSAFSGLNLKRSLSVGSEVTSSSDVLTGSGSVSMVGAGIHITADQGVDVGEILAVDTAGRFAKANATRASSGASELPQNPLGVAMANGQSSSYETIFMSTISGAVVLAQLDSTPSSGDIGMPVFLSSTSGKGSMSMPAGASPANGLTRVTQVGTLLSITASTATNSSSQNVNLYPILWGVDYIVDK